MESKEKNNGRYKVEIGISPNEADLAIASIDDQGTPGNLNKFVMHEYGYNINSLPNRDQLTYGFSQIPTGDRKPILFVVTIGQRDTRTNLERNLFDALSEFRDEFYKKKVWLPLMGTGAGGLTLDESYSITIRVVDKFLANYPMEVDFIISVPDDKKGKELFQQIKGESKISDTEIKTDKKRETQDDNRIANYIISYPVSDELRTIIDESWEYARAHDFRSVLPEHLWFLLMDSQNKIIQTILNDLFKNEIGAINNEIRIYLKRALLFTQPVFLQAVEKTNDVIQNIGVEAQKIGATLADTSHLLLSLLNTSTEVGEILYNHGISYDWVIKYLNSSKVIGIQNAGKKISGRKKKINRAEPGISNISNTSKKLPKGEKESKNQSDASAGVEVGPSIGKGTAEFQVTARLHADLWTLQDKLGYSLYAKAITEFLLHKETKPPLTVGILAPWGQGKTTLMHLVMEELGKKRRTAVLLDQKLSAEPAITKKTMIHRLMEKLGRKKLTEKSNNQKLSIKSVLAKKSIMQRIMKWLNHNRRLDEPVDMKLTRNPSLTINTLLQLLNSGTQPTVHKLTNPIVWFNAWKYQTCEQLWAGMAHTIISQLVAKLPSRIEQEKFWLHLQMKRIDSAAIRRDIHRVIFEKLSLWLIMFFCIGVVGAFVIVSFWGFNQFLWFTSVPPFLGSILKWLDIRKKEYSKTVEGKFEKYITQPDYEAKMGYFYQVEEDLKKVFDLLVDTENPVIIFVDDLDRCVPGKVAEIVEAINLFLSSDFPNCYFVVGMDAQVVASSLDVAYEKLASKLQHISSAHGSMGWYFLEKFIQLPFIIPNMSDAQKKEFVDDLFPSEKPVITKAEENAAYGEIDILLKAPQINFEAIREKASSIVNLQSKDESKFRELTNRVLEERAKISTDKDIEIKNILDRNGKYLRSTPRALKRFANLYRFYRFTQLSRSFQQATSASDTELGVWVTLMMRWPQIVRFIQWETDIGTFRGYSPVKKAMLLERAMMNSASYVKWSKKINSQRLGTIEDIHDEQFYDFLNESINISSISLHRALEVGMW
ncbi:MAG: P-loop NTPase fold protein [Bacteroidota bacterium]|jgi:hypothetical protein